MFAAMQRYDGVGRDELRTGQVVSRANSNLQQIQIVLGMLPIPIGVSAQFAVSVVAMLWLSPPLALVTLVTLTVVPALAFTAARSRVRLVPANRATQAQAATIAEHVEETVTGVRVVKGFGQEDAEAPRCPRPVRSAPSPWAAGRPCTAASTSVRSSLRGVLTLLAGAARLLSNFTVTAQQARAASERVHEIIDAKPDITDHPHARDLPDGPLELELRDVTCREAPYHRRRRPPHDHGGPRRPHRRPRPRPGRRTGLPR
ncbi:hypothetical protein ADK57_10730 [Streptomyces sp. MMG1533]|nr:hypothetical protein ADK57_10730 [Streptomyces sp. MMG1533]